MVIKVYINVAIIHFVILTRHLHSYEKLDDNGQEVNCTNALNFIAGSAVRPFNMSTEQIDDIGSQTQFSAKLNQILKISSEQIVSGQSNAEYVSAINNSLDIINAIKTDIELDTKMKYNDIVTKQDTEKNLNEIIELMEHEKVIQASNYVKSKRRVTLDQSSENSKLFDNLLATGVSMFDAAEQSGDGTQLGVCQIRCKMKDNIDEKEFMDFMQFTNNSAQMNDNGKDKYLIFWILLDKGSSHNLLHDRLKNFIVYDSLGSKDMKMSTSVSQGVMNIEQGLFDVYNERNESYRMKIQFIPSLTLNSGWNNSETRKLLIMHETGMKESDTQRFIWPSTDNRTIILGSLGSDCLSAHGVEVIPEDIGLKNFLYSPDIKIISIPWCYSSKMNLLVTGPVGVDKSRVVNHPKAKYPVFSIDENWLSLSNIPDDRVIDVLHCVQESKDAVSFGLTLEEARSCLKQYGVVDKWTAHKYQF